MPLPKRVRVDAAPDPLAAPKKAQDPLAPATAVAGQPDAGPSGGLSGAERVRQQIEERRAAKDRAKADAAAAQQPKVNRKETFGAAYDPALKQVHRAHNFRSGATLTDDSLFALFGQPSSSSSAGAKKPTVAAAAHQPTPATPDGGDQQPQPSLEDLLSTLQGSAPSSGASAAVVDGSGGGALADPGYWWAYQGLPRPRAYAGTAPPSAVAAMAAAQSDTAATTTTTSKGAPAVVSTKGTTSLAEAMDPIATIPDVEPWDEELLCAPSYDLGLDDAKIDTLQHHIPQLVGWNPEPDVPPMQLMRTPEERRRERHNARVERAKAQQQDQHLGLLGREQQKWTLKHVNQGVPQLRHAFPGLAPAELEQTIKKQQEKRILDHYERNHVRHYEAVDHQKGHYFDVLERHASERPQIVVYRVEGVTDRYTLDTVKITAKQRYLRGVVLWIASRAALIVLIGGERAQRRVAVKVRNPRRWPEGCLVDRLWVSHISEQANESLYFQKHRLAGISSSGNEPGAPSGRDASKMKKKGGGAAVPAERVQVIALRTPRDAMELLHKQQLAHVWLAAVGTPVLGAFARGVGFEADAVAAGGADTADNDGAAAAGTGAGAGGDYMEGDTEAGLW